MVLSRQQSGFRSFLRFVAKLSVVSNVLATKSLKDSVKIFYFMSRYLPFRALKSFRSKAVNAFCPLSFDIEKQHSREITVF